MGAWIRYRLPLSAVRVTGTVTYVEDMLAASAAPAPLAAASMDSVKEAIGFDPAPAARGTTNPGDTANAAGPPSGDVEPRESATTAAPHAADPKPDRASSTELIVVGDERVNLAVELEDGILKDSDASFTLTEDGRFVGSKVSITGVGTKVVTGLVGIVTTGLGVAAGVASKVAQVAAFGGPVIGAPADELTPADHAYKDAFQALWELRTKLRGAVAVASTTKAEAAAALASAAPAAIPAASSHLRASTLALDTLRGELERVDKHYSAWRATTMSSRVESYEFLLTIEELITAGTCVEDGHVKYQPPPDQFIGPVHEAAKVEAQRLWDTLGIAVTIVDPLGPIKPPWADIPVEVRNPGRRGLVVRLPRTVTLEMYTQDAAGRAVLLSSRPALILDRRCRHLVIGLSASIFGKQTRELTFSKEGIMTGFSTQATSGVGTLLDVAAGLPASVASALEQSTNIATRIGTLRTSAMDQEIARAKKEVELKEQELALAGINATEGTYVELEELKRKAELLAQHKLIYETGAVFDPTNVELDKVQAKVDLLTARLERALAQRALDAERQLPATGLSLEELRALLGASAAEASDVGGTPAADAPKAT